jgi:hypothetical protein
MKYFKIVGLFVMAAASLIAFAGSASAAGTFTSPTGTAYTGLTSQTLEGSALIKAGFAEITCTTGTIAANLTTNNESEASGSTTSIAFSNCTSPQGTPTVTTLSSKGTLKIVHGTHAVSGTGVEVTTAVLGTSCVYGMGTGTALGVITNTIVGGEDKVTLDIDASLPKISGGFLCASPAAWTLHALVTTPTTSFVD